MPPMRSLIPKVDLFMTNPEPFAHYTFELRIERVQLPFDPLGG